MQTIAHFEYTDPGFEKPTPEFLTDGQYSQMLSTISFGCCDTLIVTDVGFLLVKRKAKPATGQWWVTGGRREMGETKSEAAARCFKRETGLEVSLERFTLMGIADCRWNSRQQKPQDAGTHQDVYVHLLKLSNEEVGKLKFDPQEFRPEDWCVIPFDKAGIMTLEGKFHPYIGWITSLAIRHPLLLG